MQESHELTSPFQGRGAVWLLAVLVEWMKEGEVTRGKGKEESVKIKRIVISNNDEQMQCFLARCFKISQDPAFQ